MDLESPAHAGLSAFYADALAAIPDLGGGNGLVTASTAVIKPSPATADNKCPALAREQGMSTCADAGGPPTRDGSTAEDGPIDLLTVSEVAELLRVSDSWIYLAIQDQRIPSLRIGGSDGPIRFLRSELTADIRSCRVGPHPPRRPNPGCPAGPRTVFVPLTEHDGGA
ncbi:helix-turn-helix domain-containing protein [Paraconexibacter antarcticus]|uniref:Helix-turn-helix domain-containing protein n=1 Tax=Paraconexibacter antarcticus TaxID=2949664 RepID=A0ABY5DXZ6_9ACTN|nr:helix-turn-helix domain-containing protein [Paraconexibacter antarcticus]UTI66906.1 helix-turn-helix domain-containing protein [Paraconexibacter antarcticus]